MTTILHLTDLHFGLESEHSTSARAQRINTLNALLDTLASLPKSDRPDVVVVSGDIGWKGHASNYAEAAEWLRSLLKVLDLAPDRLVICPGNHDVDLEEADGMERSSDAARADELLRVEKLLKLSRAFAAFEAFARKMGIPPHRVGKAESYLVGVRDVLGIRFVVANTAWFCRDKQDKGKLFIGLPQLEVMSAEGQLFRPHEFDQADFTVVVLHHPETWLADDETASYEGRAATYYYLADRSHLLLSGHTHGGLDRPRRIGDGGMLIVGGASYSGRRYRNNVSLLRLDDAARTVERTPYEFDPRDDRWHAREATTHTTRREPAPPPENRKPAAGTEPRERIPAQLPHNLPPRQETFAGRKAELEEVHARLGRTREVGVTQQTAVHGHGGIGKTALAIEYGWTRLADYPGGVFFLSCESELPPPLAELAPYLSLESAATADETALQVKARLEMGEPCLLILDNVEGARQWRSKEWSRILPGKACRRLVTTRAESLADVEMYSLQRLTTEDGLRLLARYRKDVGDNEASAAAVVEWFDGLAVGLTVVGAYMSMHQGLSWPKYVDHLNEKGLGAVRQMETAADSLLSYERRVDAVFDELLEALPNEQRRALEYAALLPEDQVYAPWVADLLANDEDVKAPELPGYEQPEEAVIAALLDRQLLRARGEEERVVGLHRVLRRRVREQLADAGAMDRLVDRVVELAERRGEASHEALTEATLRRELTPLAALSLELDALGRTEEAAGLANWISTPLRELGRFTEARALLEEFATAERLETLSVVEAAALLSNLAGALQDIGEGAEARQRMERAIEIEERHFDTEHLALATKYSNLAVILQDLEELAEARRLMERAIEMEERHFNPDHPALAIRYSNLATIFYDLKELAEARRLMERAIEIQERHFNPDHPALATMYSNLAIILKEFGELAEARRWMERVIAINERHFDPDHPALATAYNNLARMEYVSSNRERACALFRRAKAILDKHFPPTHPHVMAVAAGIEQACTDG